MHSTDPWTAFARHPDEETFRPLYEATKRLAWTLCCRILRDEADASDAFQATWCRLLAVVRESAGERSSAPRTDCEHVDDAAAIVSRIAIREADSLRKRRARRRARQVPWEETLPMPETQRTHDGPADEAASRELRGRLEALVEALPEVHRLPVQLHFFHGLSQREVARALGQPLSTVASRIESALGRLDPACRRAGLGPASGALAGIALGGALLEPALPAAEVFAQAQAVVAAASASAGAGAGAGSAAVAVPTTFTTVLGGLLVLKAKSIALAAALAALVFVFLGTWAVDWREDRPQVAPDPLAGAPSPRAESLLPRSERLDRGAAAGERPEDARDGTEVTEPGRPNADSGAAGAISGIVTDVLTGAPLPGARVESGERSATTDAEGRYRLDGLDAGVHEVVASSPGRADALARVNQAAGGESVQDFALDPGFTVLVTVVDEEGGPLAGAKVVPSMLGSGDGSYYLDEAIETDGAGRAVINGISRLRPRTIQAMKDGYESGHARPPANADLETVELRIVLKPRRSLLRAIAGRVSDRGGNPIAGAVVEWKDGEGTAFGDGIEYGQFRATSGADGSYRLEFTDDYDTCHLGVAAAGWAPQVARGVRCGTPEEPARVDFELEPAHFLEGRVVDEAGTPLAGVEIEAMPREDLLNEGVAYPAVLRRASTDAAGRFRLDDLAGPSVALRLRAPDERPTQEREIEVNQEIELVLEGYGEIRGRVVDAASGEPVAVFKVSRWGDVPGGSSSLEGESFTAEDGRFVLRRLHRRGTYRLTVRADGYLRAQLEGIAPVPEAGAATGDVGADEGELVVALERGAALEGVVFDPASGAPLAGVTVLSTLSERAHELFPMDWALFPRMVGLEINEAVTADDGAFAFREAAPETLMLRAAGRRKLLILPAERDAWRGRDGRLWIALPRGERLSGVFAHDGRPMRAVTLRLERLEPRVRRAATAANAPPAGEKEYEAVARTDSEGRFSWEDLSPGRYVLEAVRKLEEPRPRLEVRLRRPVEVRMGEPAAVDLGESLGPCTLRGRLSGMETRAALAAEVVLRPLGGDDVTVAEIVFSTYKDWEWRFACPDLRAGKYAVEVSYWTAGGTRARALAPIEVAGDEERDLEIPAGEGGEG